MNLHIRIVLLIIFISDFLIMKLCKIDKWNLILSWTTISSANPGLSSPIRKLRPSIRFRKTPTTNLATRAVKNSTIAQKDSSKSAVSMNLWHSSGNFWPTGIIWMLTISPYGWKKPEKYYQLTVYKKHKFWIKIAFEPLALQNVGLEVWYLSTL